MASQSPGSTDDPRPPRRTHQRPIARPTRSKTHNSAKAAATKSACINAPAEAGSSIAISGAVNRRKSSTAKVGGCDGPKISAISTTDSE